MRSSIEDFVKSEDTDINGDKPTSGVSNQVNEQFSANLYKKAYERVVNEIVDKRERIAKHLNDEAKTQEELSKRQLEQLFEQNVSSCDVRIPVQEEVKAQDVVSAPGAAQGKGKGVQQTTKGKGKGKGKPKNKSKGKGQPDGEFWQGKEEHIQGDALEKERGKHGGKTGGKSKGQKPSMTRWSICSPI